MKILFSAGDFDKQLHANNKILYQIAQSLAEKGNECIFTGVSLYDNACCEQQGNLKLVRFNSFHPCDRAFLAMENFVRETDADRETARKKFYIRHPLHSAALMYRYNISKNTLFSVDSYIKQVGALAQKERPDVMVVCYMPFEHAHRLITGYEWDIPLIAYQLDPWGLHCTVTDDASRAIRIAEETSVFEKCSKIITTNVLHRQYSQHPDYQKYLDKMVTLNFPNVKPSGSFAPSDCVFDFDSDKVNLLFCGIVSDEYRSPQFLLDSLRSVRDGDCTNFAVHFLGTSHSRLLTQFMEKNDWVKYHGNVPLEKAFATMAQSDVLINIGNTFTNQVPSKIFDYFAFGKPILNVEKIADCPAREYFERYPLSLSLKEWFPEEENRSNLAEFILDAKKNTMPYDTVEQLFGDCTLNYATDVFCDIINKI